MRVKLERYDSTETLQDSIQLLYVETIIGDKNSGLEQITLPEQDSEDNQLIKFNGETETLKLTAKILESATDLSNGSGIYTVLEQIEFLKDYFVNETIDDYFILRLQTDADVDIFTFTGIISRLSWNLIEGQDWGFCNLDFVCGTVV